MRRRRSMAGGNRTSKHEPMQAASPPPDLSKRLIIMDVVAPARGTKSSLVSTILPRSEVLTLGASVPRIMLDAGFLSWLSAYHQRRPSGALYSRGICGRIIIASRSLFRGSGPSTRIEPRSGSLSSRLVKAFFGRSWSPLRLGYRSDNPVCAEAPTRPLEVTELSRGEGTRHAGGRPMLPTATCPTDKAGTTTEHVAARRSRPTGDLL
jgi:hypothetical protein